MSRRERPNSNSDYSSFIDEWHQQLISRRRFILDAAVVVSVSLFSNDSYSATSGQAAKYKSVENNTEQPGKHVLQTLSAVQDHLFPKASDSPGAVDINALTYLQNNVLNDVARDQEEKQFILKGVGWLDDLSMSTLNKNFLKLNEQQREKLLRQIEKSSAGENWLSTVLLYIFEALLSDPVYGGNPDGVGWKWLEHQPGFPRPPANKIYGKLG